jgi:ATP-dependent Clp protease ATP-binding subunit ClpA
MRLDFTVKAHEALLSASQTAQESGQQEDEPEHLLLALVREHDDVARALLEAAGASPRKLAVARRASRRDLVPYSSAILLCEPRLGSPPRQA